MSFASKRHEFAIYDYGVYGRVLYTSRRRDYCTKRRIALRQIKTHGLLMSIDKRPSDKEKNNPLLRGLGKTGLYTDYIKLEAFLNMAGH